MIWGRRREAVPRLARHDLQVQYTYAITSGINTSFVNIGQAIAVNESVV